MEKYSKRPNRRDLIKNANPVELIDRVSRLGIWHTALMYKCVSSDVVNQLAKLHVSKVLIPNVKYTDDRILYMYKENGVLFMSKKLGGEYYMPNGKPLKNSRLHFERVNVVCTPDEIYVTKDEVENLLKSSSLESVSRSLNAYQHRIARFVGMEVEDDD